MGLRCRFGGILKIDPVWYNTFMEMVSKFATRTEAPFQKSIVENKLTNVPAKAHCLWCDRVFTLRVTGGSAQKFCTRAHRQAFWIAARRWTLLALDAGLLSVECLKAAQASVHAGTAMPRTATGSLR
jgi:hypothetical protein